MQREKSLRTPTLETLFMIEEFVRQHSGEFTKTQLWKSLPRKVMYQTFCVAYDYLLTSSKITTDPRNSRVIWIWDEDLVKRILMRKRASKLAREVVKVPTERVPVPLFVKKQKELI